MSDDSAQTPVSGPGEPGKGMRADSGSAAYTLGAMGSEDLVRLGQALVSELGYTTSNDILGRWMAHHIAEVMQEAKQQLAGSPERHDAEERCRRLILDLWERRHARPGGWPGPRAVEIVQLLEELPSLEADWWHSQSSLGQLQELHYRILGAVTDWLAATADTSVDERWLSVFGSLLTDDERVILMRVAGASSRSSDMTSGLSRLLRQYGIRDDSDLETPSGAVFEPEDERRNGDDLSLAESLERSAGRVPGRSPTVDLKASNTVDISELSEGALSQLEGLSAAYLEVVASIASVIEQPSDQAGPEPAD